MSITLFEAPDYFKRFFDEDDSEDYTNEQRDKDFKKCIKDINNETFYLGDVSDTIGGEIERYANLIKEFNNKFKECQSDIDVIYSFMRNLKICSKIIFLIILEKIIKYQDKIYDEFESYFEY